MDNVRHSPQTSHADALQPPREQSLENLRNWGYHYFRAAHTSHHAFRESPEPGHPPTSDPWLCAYSCRAYDVLEDVNHYLTSWKLPTNGSWQPRITLRHLLGHTAGLVYNWYRGFRHRAQTPSLFQVLEGQPPANTPPVRATLIPGSQFRYSGSHYSVLQQLLIDVTGKPFPALMQELVFHPLEMHNSSYDQSYPDTRPESTAVGHHLGGEPVAGKWRVFPFASSRVA